MTKEEAIDILKTMSIDEETWHIWGEERVKPAFDMAIEALGKELCKILDCEDAERPMNVKGECTGDEDFCSYEPCEDCVSRQDAIDTVVAWGDRSIDEAVEHLEVIPSVQPKIAPCSDCISRESAISFPFANGKYDKKNANEDFIAGCESYREWLEQLPTVKPTRPKDH